MRTATRLRQVGESPTLSLTRRVFALRRQGRQLIDLGAGEPFYDPPSAAVLATSEALTAGYTRYTEVQGPPDVRQAIADEWSRSGWGTDNVLVTVGAKAALFQLAMALFDRGDRVVIPTPAWSTLAEQVRLAGANVRLARLDESTGFAMDLEKIWSCVDSTTRAIVINSPCNPTGRVIQEQVLAELAERCAEAGMLLISDETYSAFVFGAHGHASVADLAQRYPETVILVSSASKTFSMTGWRVGYLLGSRDVVSAARSIQSHTTSNATTFAMYGLAAALRECASEVESRRQELAERASEVVKQLEAMGATVAPCEGSFYAFFTFPEFRQRGLDGTRIALELLEREDVVLIPGAAFGADDYVRICFARSKQEVDAGLERLACCISRLG